MPQLAPYYKDILDVAFYLYRSVDDANNNRRFGGTGFLVSMPTTGWGGENRHVYAVTNWHVAVRDRCSVVRLNTIDGNTDVFDLQAEDWTFIENGYDVAVAPLPVTGRHKVKHLDQSFFMSPEDAANTGIGPGEDVFMVGRFVDYDGGPTNRPSVRFGNISMMDVPIVQQGATMRPCFVLDMHSRSGYSGSPVFVYRTPGSVFPAPDGKVWQGGHVMRLLGIHCGQFAEYWELTDASQDTAAESFLLLEEHQVKGWSGMTTVVPWYAISDVLNSRPLVEKRKAEERAADATRSAAEH